MEARFFIFRGGAKNMLDQTMEIACFEKNACPSLSVNRHIYRF